MVRAAPRRKARHDHDRGHVVPHATIHTVIGGGGQALHVREWGPPDGPPVLLIHGWSGNHMCWRHQVDSALVEEFRIVALDLRGHGMSDRSLDAGRYQDARLWAADIAAVIGQLHLDRPTLVGWSYGGFVICDYLRAFGESAVSAINFVGAAVNLNERFDDIGPAFLSNAPAGADPDLPTRIAALRRFWRSMSADPLDPTDFETGLCGSVSVPPQVLSALISRQIDSDPVLAADRPSRSWSPTAARTRSSCPPWPNTSSRPAPRPRHPGTTGPGTSRSPRIRRASTTSWPS